VNVSTEMALSPGSATSTTAASSPSSSAHSTDLDSPQKWFHPFAGSTGKLEILPSSANSDMIDVEEEARLYDELCRNYEEDSDTFVKFKPQTRRTSSVHDALKMAGARPQSVFSADIYLSDNTGRAPTLAFAQDVRVAGWTTVGDGAGRKNGSGAYVIYDCVILTKERTTMHILKRYSEFEELHDTLKRSLPYSLLPSLPTLPPKAALARFRPAFLDGRRKLLQFWLASVLLHPELGGRDVVRSWVLR